MSKLLNPAKALARAIGCSKRSVVWMAAACSFITLASLQPAARTQAQTQATLPDAPKSLARWIKLGKVDFDFYRIPEPDQKYKAETRFHLDVNYSFQFRTRRIAQSTSSIHRVFVRLSGLEVEVENLILLPESTDRNDFWDSSLVRHEFDHVRISSDPRATKLLRFLVAQIDIVDVPVGPANPTAERVKLAVDEKVQTMIQAVSNLIQQNYDYLDELTTHGGDKSPDAEFFESLYTEANLQKMGFPFLQQAKPLLNKRDYLATP
ncbi:MAG: hypothetical protein NXI32_13630 [bacterium]|nr:hypothetical protein [bacterium]